jgi:hypothetical protein
VNSSSALLYKVSNTRIEHYLLFGSLAPYADDQPCDPYCINVFRIETGRDYAVPMNEDVRSTLRQIRGTVRGGYVFINPEAAKPYTDVKTAYEERNAS